MCNTDVEICVAPFYQQFYYGHVLPTSTFVAVAPTAVPRSREDFWGAKFLLWCSLLVVDSCCKNPRLVAPDGGFFILWGFRAGRGHLSRTLSIV